MPEFSKRSRTNLKTCHPDLRAVFMEVIKHFDVTIIEGHRSHERQLEMYETGLSKARPGQSKHNLIPSKAIDVAPYPIDFSDRERFTLLAGYALGIAEMMGIKLRWGGDWDQDMEVADNGFDDLPHFELVG